VQLLSIEYKITFSIKMKSNFYTSSKTPIESCIQRDIFFSNIHLSFIFFSYMVTIYLDTIYKIHFFLSIFTTVKVRRTFMKLSLHTLGLILSQYGLDKIIY